MVAATLKTAEADAVRWFVRAARVPRLRTIREFAEQEIIVPDGPFAGYRFRCDRQPWTRLFFDAFDQFPEIAVTGPSQSGKTFITWVIPVLYHLFEIGETVVCGLPLVEMAGAKWLQDLEPVIRRTRYADLMPRQIGAGSRGGIVDTRTFANGATLKFMSGGGSDKKRAGFTTRVVILTETDGMDTVGGTSRETDKIRQMEARTRAYGDNRRIYKECTVSTEDGHIWQAYRGGTRSRIATPCVHCGAWVTPEREHLHGWQEAASTIEAKALAHFRCPACDGRLDDAARREMNRRGLLLHDGQTVEQGEVVGEPPQTEVLGFRYSAFQNLFAPCGQLGAEEWEAVRSDDPDNTERERCQFVWAVPYETPTEEDVPLTRSGILARTSGYARGEVPEMCDVVTVGIDVAKRHLEYVVLAFDGEGRAYVVDYASAHVDSQERGERLAITQAIKSIQSRFDTGWVQRETGQRLRPTRVLIDSGWHAPTVYDAIRRMPTKYRSVWFPCKGYGGGEFEASARHYRRPKPGAKGIRLIGDGYHVATMRTDAVDLVEIDSDQWKTTLHDGLAVDVSERGAVLLCEGTEAEHRTFIRHLTAERKVTETSDKDNRPKTFWKRIYRQNHYLDCTTYGMVAGHYAGVRLMQDSTPKAPKVSDWFNKRKGIRA